MTAAVTSAIGLTAMARTTASRELPLAAMPLFFAAQQMIEGLLWIYLPASSDGYVANELTLAYLFMADVFWPIYVPLMALLIEPRASRRRLMMVCLFGGIGVGGTLLLGILARSHAAAILDGHIVYVTEPFYPAVLTVGYLAATSFSLMLSSDRTVVRLGMIICAGSIIAYAFYWESFTSVWCFFAAAGSVVILWRFERLRRAAHLVRGA